MEVLEKLQKLYESEPEKFSQFADDLTRGIKEMDLVSVENTETDYKQSTLDDIFKNWQNSLDFKKGGQSGSPKFPMPVSYEYLLHYYYLSQDKKALDAVMVTLENIAAGGIYDHLGGGFARYSTDANWKVPHFEKMLYDNGQLVSLYSSAYQLTKKPVFKEVVYETLSFIEREMTSPEGGFYSSYDADSEGEEGKFYVWTKEEIDRVLGKEADLLNDYFQVTASGNWEKKNNILYREISTEKLLGKYKIKESDLQKRIQEAKSKLFKEREKMIKPNLDDKVLTSWNALMLKAYVDAYRVFGEAAFLEKAKKNADFIIKKMKNGKALYRNYKDGKAVIKAFLDDYSFTIEALIALYQATFEEKWLNEAKALTEYTLAHFYDTQTGLFFYTSDLDPALITRKIELSDNVIPASNSSMAKSLFLLGEYFYKKDYSEKSARMLQQVSKDVIENGSYYPNWLLLMTYFIKAPYEIAIVGNDFEKIRKELDQHYLPHAFLMGGKNEGSLPLLENKLQKGQTTIYVCQNKSCKLPVTETRKALELMK